MLNWQHNKNNKDNNNITGLDCDVFVGFCFFGGVFWGGGVLRCLHSARIPIVYLSLEFSSVLCCVVQFSPESIDDVIVAMSVFYVQSVFSPGARQTQFFLGTF